MLGIILCRAGSKGLPDKCVRLLLGRPVLNYTFDHVRASRCLTGCVLTTDSEPAKKLAREAGIEVIDRPAELASDTATVDAAVRHAVETWEHRHNGRVDAVALLYGNIPIRGSGLIDRAIEHLRKAGADSVRSVAPVSKQHPDWLHRIEGDRMQQFRSNSIYRRQDLDPLYYHDGAIAVVTRNALFQALDTPNDHQSFLGKDRRAIVQAPEDAVDIDAAIDLCLAEALLRNRMARGTETTRIDSIPIGSRLVGPSQPVFIVAEAGVNHNGKVDTALQLVDAAAEAGADAVKFQLFQASDLVTPTAATTAAQQRGCGQINQQTMLASVELSFHDLRRIREHCEARGIILLATPFGPDQVKQIVELGLAAIKIASTDIVHYSLLEKAAATGLPLIVSTGAASEYEIGEFVSHLEKCGARDRLILMHCVSAYPTPLDHANLKGIQSLERTFGLPCGFSDHTLSTQTGAWAVAAGACVLEKHLTLDRSDQGPDHAISLDPEQFAEYTGTARESWQARGTGIIGMTEIEKEVRSVARRSIVSTVCIAAGTCLTPDLLSIKRPGTGIEASHLEQLVGRTAIVDIAANTILTWEMVR